MAFNSKSPKTFMFIYLRIPIIAILSWNPDAFRAENWALRMRLSSESFHNALRKICLTFQPQLFQAIRPIVLPSSRCPKTAAVIRSQTDTNGPKEIRQTRMHQSSPFPPASYWDLFIRNRMQIICYSWAFLTHGHRCGALFGFDRLKLLMRTQRRVNLINHVD